ncbi:MAG TPA: hypothetical protein VFT64_01350 [Rickettsiales bacterium]|nr:hypothetical protein [Rickettsiales bacterium]
MKRVAASVLAWIILTPYSHIACAVEGIERNTTNIQEASPDLTADEVNAIMQQVQKCWEVPEEAWKMDHPSVILKMEVSRTGKISNIKLVEDTARAKSSASYRKLVAAAIHAMSTCSPLKKLPPQKYETWHEMEMNFDASTFDPPPSVMENHSGSKILNFLLR